MDLYHDFFDLKPGIRDKQLVDAVDGYMGHNVNFLAQFGGLVKLASVFAARGDDGASSYAPKYRPEIRESLTLIGP
jgi:hypothetical protein